MVWRYLLKRDDDEPAPWTREGKERIKKLGLTMQVEIIRLYCPYNFFLNIFFFILFFCWFLFSDGGYFLVLGMVLDKINIVFFCILLRK